MERRSLLFKTLDRLHSKSLGKTRREYFVLKESINKPQFRGVLRGVYLDIFKMLKSNIKTKLAKQGLEEQLIDDKYIETAVEVMLKSKLGEKSYKIYKLPLDLKMFLMFRPIKKEKNKDWKYIQYKWLANIINEFLQE